MEGELSVPNCHLPVLDVCILPEFMPLKMQCFLTAYATGKENKLLLDSCISQ